LTAPLRLAVDLQALQVEGFADRGIGRYIAGATAALARAGRVAAGLLAPELPPPSGLPMELAAAGLVRFDCRTETRRLLAANGPVARHVPAPFLHCGPTDPSVLVTVPHWAETGVARVVTLHDLIPLRHPQQYLPTEAHRRRYRTRAAWVGSAELVLANSEHTRIEAIDLLDCDPAAVVTVGAGVSPFFSPPDETDHELFRFWLARLEHRPFVLTVSGSDARKGTATLVAAVGALVRSGIDVDLLVVGDLTAAWRAQLAEAARRAGIEEKVVLAGPVGDDLLRACYRRALVTVMPSLAEGFGLPVLESAACATPALASDRTALVEVAATPLATFDPTDAEAVAQSVRSLLTDETRRARILAAQQELAAGSTWEAVAARTVTALDEAGDRLSPAAPGAFCGPARARLALVGPLPPAGGGIATHNARLLETLAPLVALDAVTPMVVTPDLPPGTGHVPADAFGLDARPASYDAVVYALGNSHGHLATVELALRHPGWLWLHEVRLPALATTGLPADDDEFAERFAWLVARSYPGRAPTAAARRAGRSVLDLVTAGVGLVPLLAERCQGLLVNSEVARRLLELDLAPLAAHPPIGVLPPPCPPVRGGPADRSAANGAGTDEVVAFGIVSMAKRPDLLVDAVALAGCRLCFVGPCPPIMAQVIGDRAAAHGIAERVRLTGAVDEPTWRRRLGEAALAVQLRESASGETSGAVLECLSAGVPVLTNLPTAAEYGEGTVALLASAEPAVVAQSIAALLDDHARRLALGRAGLAFARSHQFGDLADALVSVVVPA